MKVRFWGTRGSLPSSVLAQDIREKIAFALHESLENPIQSVDHIESWIDENLPFWVRGTYGTSTACVQVDLGVDEYVVIDAGSGIRLCGHHILSNGDTKPKHIHLFLSHLHWDHIQGFPFFAPAYSPENTITIHTLHDNAEEAFRQQMSEPCFPISMDELSATIRFRKMTPDEPMDFHGGRVIAKAQNHPGVSYGFRFEHQDKSFVFATDCELPVDGITKDPSYIAFYKDADLLAFDAQYTHIEAAHTKQHWGHSSNVTAVESAMMAGVKRLALFHTEPSKSDKELDKFLADTQHYAKLYQQQESDLNIPELLIAYGGLELSL